MFLGIIAVVVTIVLVIVQNYLSSRKNWLWGIIVPILSVAIMSGIAFVEKFPISWRILLPCVLILVVELFIWADKRIAHKRAELNKMKAKDM